MSDPQVNTESATGSHVSNEEVDPCVGQADVVPASSIPAPSIPAPSIPAQAIPTQANADANQLPKVIRFEALARCGDEIWIENDGQIYRLRRTRQGKLILTK